MVLEVLRKLSQGALKRANIAEKMMGEDPINMDSPARKKQRAVLMRFSVDPSYVQGTKI